MDAEKPRWLGVPCESDAWPFSSDITVFEARRAVGQLARTIGDGLNPPGLEPSNVEPVLRYLRAADALEAALGEVRKDLVAEARARGLPWGKIGRALGVRDTAAQKRFPAPTDRRLAQLKTEAMTCWMAQQAANPHKLQGQFASDLAGATPLERLEYLVRHALETMREVNELSALAESDPERALTALKKTCGRIERVTTSVIVDHVMWDAMADWTGRPETGDQTNYHASATYLLHAMRLLVFALLHAPDEESADVAHFLAFLSDVHRIYATVLLIFERPDVGSTVPSPEAT